MGLHSDGQPSSQGINVLPDDHKDFYKVLGVDFDATEDSIRSNYLRLALKWHPDKHSDEPSATLRFQKINEAYRVLSDPVKRQDYDLKGEFVEDCSISASACFAIGYVRKKRHFTAFCQILFLPASEDSMFFSLCTYPGCITHHGRLLCGCGDRQVCVIQVTGRVHYGAL